MHKRLAKKVPGVGASNDYGFLPAAPDRSEHLGGGQLKSVPGALATQQAHQLAVPAIKKENTCKEPSPLSILKGQE